MADPVKWKNPMRIEVPTSYSKLTAAQRRQVREQYTIDQRGECLFCKQPLAGKPPRSVTSLKINWRYFPPGFLKNPIHLQHDHTTDQTEGAVHAYCNAVMWQYHNR